MNTGRPVFDNLQKIVFKTKVVPGIKYSVFGIEKKLASVTFVWVLFMLNGPENLK